MSGTPKTSGPRAGTPAGGDVSGSPCAMPDAINAMGGSALKEITGGSIERALATREGQAWAAPSKDLSAAVVSRIRASHGRKPLTAREPADAFVLRARLLPVPALVAGLSVAAMLAIGVVLPLAVSPAGRGLIMRTPLASSAGDALGGVLTGGHGHRAARTSEGGVTHAGTVPAPALAATSVNEPLAEEARRLGDDTRRAADAVLSTLQVAPSEAPPRR